MRCKIQQRTTGLRSSHSFLHYSEPGNKILCRIHVARNTTVSTIVSNRATAKRSNALMWRVADTVSTIVPNRATRDNRIRRCVKAPLKNQQGNVDCLFFCVENSGSKFCVLKVLNLRTFFSTQKIEAYQASFRLFHNNFNYC